VKEFATFTKTIKEMGNMLEAEGIKEIAMESTGIYWVPVWNILEDMGFSLTLVNPYQIKQMPGRKSDVKDAQWIATLLHKGLIRGSLVPSKRIRELRAYSRKYVKLQGRMTSVLTGMERLLEISGIRITSLASNISGKSIEKVFCKLIDGVSDPEELSKCIHRRIVKRHGKKAVLMSLGGNMQKHHRVMLKLAYDEYALLRQQVRLLEAEMSQICQEHYQEEMALLKTLPGVSEQSSMQIIAETGAEMNAFENSGKISGWAGLRPRNDESAGKMKSTAVTKGNKYLRRILVQCAWAASRTKGSHFKARYERLSARGKLSKKALVANARKLLVLVWHMLKNREAYDSSRQPAYSKAHLEQKIKYHQREIARLGAMCVKVG
jgi:transposase